MIVAVLVAGVAAAGAPAHAVGADVMLRRLDEELLRVEYVFDEPIQAIEFPRGINGYRSEHWSLDPGVLMLTPGTADRIVAEGDSFDRVSVTVRMAAAYPEGNYVPFAHFSDGGVAIFLGYFSGMVVRHGRTEEAKFRFRLAGRHEERVLLPAAAEESSSLFAYIGRTTPAERGELRVLLDPNVPDWLAASVSETIARIAPVYEARLGAELPAKPFVWIAAADLDTIDGYSVKGGSVDGEMIVFTLRGRVLRAESEEVRDMMVRLVAHELAHLWQLADPAIGFQESQPWIHEGAAEAIAIAALVESGLWTEEQRDTWSSSMAVTCESRGGAGSLHAAACGGDMDAIYSCGYGMFVRDGRSPFEIWNALLDEARARGQPYHQGMLDTVLGAR